ncbi:MAG TPA: glycosyltransferase family 9 protein [Candidatus Eremiobacteraceae bacterium]|nr:glycosyltransferase family 9 protein [Candidatus Eremiobacteraceae bacterium]
MSILLFLLPGLGDALAAGPILDGIQVVGRRVDVLAMLDPVAEYARSLPMVERVDQFDLNAGRGEAVRAARTLRARRYDIALLPFPATRWEYHALARAIGAKRLVTHRYGGFAEILDRTQHVTLVDLAGGHRAAENQRLAHAAGLGGGLHYVLPATWHIPARHGLLGVHTGTMRYKGNEVRRWPVERFASLVDRSLAAGRSIRIFIGPHESEDEVALARFRESPAVEFVKTDLGSAARSLSECEVFVGNDAGFAHLAAGLNVKTVVLFGMTDPLRLQPLGPSMAVRPTSCPACHDEGMKTFACVLDIGYRCTRMDLTVDIAAAAVDRAFAGPVAALRPTLAGPFRLYGRGRAATSALITTTIDSSIHSNPPNSDAASGA